jgi:hypothetical protein
MKNHSISVLEKIARQGDACGHIVRPGEWGCRRAYREMSGRDGEIENAGHADGRIVAPAKWEFRGTPTRILEDAETRRIIRAHSGKPVLPQAAPSSLRLPDTRRR